jgi:TonB family protein
MRTAVICILTVAIASACSLNANRVGRPGIDFELPPESPPYPQVEKHDASAPSSLDSGKSNAPPRLLKQTRPEYPRWAFDRKIIGVVMLEIVIDKAGRVVAWKVLKSIPELDAAAIRCVRQWEFSPAMVGGEPVLTIANAPISFRIF